MLKKLVLVYNPRASKHAVIEREVLAPARKLQGWLVGKYEVQAADLATNARKLAKILHDGDLVVAVGGDGTASMAANAILDSGKDATLAVMGYGNFNDMARLLRTKRPVEYGGEFVGGIEKILAKFEDGRKAAEKSCACTPAEKSCACTEIYPLEVKVDGEHWRWAVCYATIGMFAASTQVFEQKKVRAKLKTGKTGLIFSVVTLTKWYFKERKQEFLPAGELWHSKHKQNGVTLNGMTAWRAGTTDYIALNSARMARILRGGKWFLQPQAFLDAMPRNGIFWRLAMFMLAGMLGRMPGKETHGDVLKFSEAATVEMQVEGECMRLENVQTIEIAKPGAKLKVVRF